jgi:hypothetical protein
LTNIDDCNNVGHGYFPAIGIWMPFSRTVCRASS